MNAVAVIVPPKVGETNRPDEEHQAIYMAYIVQGMSGDDAADYLNKNHGMHETRMSIIGYSSRQGWKKGTGHGRTTRKPQPDPARPGMKPKVRGVGPRARRLTELDIVDLATGRVVERGCRFPVGPSPQYRMSDQLFCGEVQADGLPYCPKCVKRAYPPTALQRMHANAATPSPTRRPR